MNSLIQYKDHIFKIKSRVENPDPEMFSHTTIQNASITPNTISIVMLASNRSKQTYFTLLSMVKNKHKDLQVIIVDDSTDDPININMLKNYPFYIDLIQINRETKDWHNCLVNFNLGFKFIKGTKVVIQSAEVCHIGNVLDFINASLLDNKYYVFDVKAAKSFETNEEIYKSDITKTDIYNRENLFNIWYQSQCMNRKLHFLTAMSRSTFDQIGGFSYDYTMGTAFDDDDFLLKIISKKINIINVFHTDYNLGGIHLFHTNAFIAWDKGREWNEPLFIKKQQIYNNKDEYIDVTQSFDTFNVKYIKLL